MIGYEIEESLESKDGRNNGILGGGHTEYILCKGCPS